MPNISPIVFDIRYAAAAAKTRRLRRAAAMRMPSRRARQMRLCAPRHCAGRCAADTLIAVTTASGKDRPRVADDGDARRRGR